MSRVCYTNLFAVLNGGQQRRVFNVISRFVNGKYAINHRDSGWPVEEPDDSVNDLKRKPDYQGATVMVQCMMEKMLLLPRIMLLIPSLPT
jgi:hypothetical protein